MLTYSTKKQTNSYLHFQIFLSSSPPSLNGDGRTDDLTAILSVIDKANEFIYIAVNEYIPVALWKNKKHWPVIDDRIKEGWPFRFFFWWAWSFSSPMLALLAFDSPMKSVEMPTVLSTAMVRYLPLSKRSSIQVL